MTDEQVKTFVDGYYPSYELYVDGLRKGIFATMKTEGVAEGNDAQGRQLRVVVGKDRKVKKVEKI